MKRIIRARLTARGFKDRDAESPNTYAGTSTRCSQRLVTSTAALRKWFPASVDVDKAFLQGMTYEEISRLIGEPVRDVSFTLPASSVAALKRPPGLGNFNPILEVLHCDKRGTGLKDAPQESR